MRVYVLALAIAMIAQPAWAHHKLNHPDFPRRPAYFGVWSDPCAVSHNPHQNAGEVALGERCRRVLEQSRAAPEDIALRERCDRIVRARTGRDCRPLH